MEKLRRKSGQTKHKIARKLARFKRQSGQGLEVQNDMTLYMTDYMNDLLSQGLSEQEAFEKASEAMRFAGESEQAAELEERFRQYYENRDPAADEAIGVFYGGFMLIGMVSGGVIAYLSGGGRMAFLSGGWIDTIIGVAIGLFIGVGTGMISHGMMAVRKKK
jgi:hypothetical protein